MALPPLALESDLGAWVGRDFDLNPDPRAGAVLSAASAIVRGYTGKTWVDETGALTAVPDEVAAVVVQVAARVWMNPGALESLTIDDSTRRWGSSGTTGLYLTDADKDALAAHRVTGAATGLGSIGLTRGAMDESTIYVPTAPEPAGYPFPWYGGDA